MLRVLLIATALLASHVSDIDTSSLVMNQGWVPYPAYDDRDGWAEQLGEYQERIAAAGAKYLHMVDLDGAKDGDTPAFDAVREVTETTSLKVEIGGGIRDEGTIERYLEAGVFRVILGTVAVTEPALEKR